MGCKGVVQGQVQGWAARIRACHIDPKRGLVVDKRGRRLIEALRHVAAMTQRIIMRDLAGVGWTGSNGSGR